MVSARKHVSAGENGGEECDVKKKWRVEGRTSRGGSRVRRGVGDANAKRNVGKTGGRNGSQSARLRHTYAHTHPHTHTPTPAPHLDAAEDVALGVGQRLALLEGDELGNLALVGAQQVLVAEERALSRDDGGLGHDVLEGLRRERRGGVGV